jgi:hypothetical protein
VQLSEADESGGMTVRADAFWTTELLRLCGGAPEWLWVLWEEFDGVEGGLQLYPLQAAVATRLWHRGFEAPEHL